MTRSPKPPYRRVLAFAGCVLMGLATVGCSAPDPVYLPALKADPMASYSHPDLELEYRLDSPSHMSWKGSEVGADVSSSWIVGDGADVDAIIGHLVGEGEKAGWSFETLEPQPVEAGETYWRAQKYFDEGLAGLAIRLDPSSWRGGVDLWMRLDFVEEDIATPVIAAVQDSSYETLADLRDAIEASGIRCTRYTSEPPSGARDESEATARCTDEVWLHVFGGHEQAQAYLQQAMDFETARGQSYLIGPNWILSFFDVELGAYLQGELGGELAATGDDT